MKLKPSDTKVSQNKESRTNFELAFISLGHFAKRVDRIYFQMREIHYDMFYSGLPFLDMIDVSEKSFKDLMNRILLSAGYNINLQAIMNP